jgi:DNA-binding HxlR family transcriptional regulator
MKRKKPELEENKKEKLIERGNDICRAIGLWEVIGRKWALLILKSLRKKKIMRFSELKRVLEGISSNVLTDRLLQLESEGLIAKKVYKNTAPSKVEYSLTPLAIELDSLLTNLDEWTDKWELSRKKQKVEGK